MENRWLCCGLLNWHNCVQAFLLRRARPLFAGQGYRANAISVTACHFINWHMARFSPPCHTMPGLLWRDDPYPHLLFRCILPCSQPNRQTCLFWARVSNSTPCHITLILTRRQQVPNIVHWLTDVGCYQFVTCLYSHHLPYIMARDGDRMACVDVIFIPGIFIYPSLLPQLAPPSSLIPDARRNGHF